VKPKAVLAYCREKDIRAIDLRFVDLGGNWKHISMPASALTENAFELGFAQEAMLRGVTNENREQLVLVPISEAHFVDPVVDQATLVLLAGILDPFSGEDSWLDSRSVAARSIQYLQSTGIADAVLLRTAQPFSLQSIHAEDSRESFPTSRMHLACGTLDEDYSFRCNLASVAMEAGVVIDRHYRAEHSTSEIVLGSSSLLDLCDDLMMVRYLIDQLALRTDRRRIATDARMPTQWMLSRGGELILSGASQLGLSEVGWYAIGGILEHAATLAAVALATPDRVYDTEYRWSKSIQSDASDSLCHVIFGHHDPRQRAIEYRGLPSGGNPYLQMAAILMAMIDGIQNKYSVSQQFRQREESTSQHDSPSDGESNLWNVSQLRQSLLEDSDFLLVGDVFSESLLETLTRFLEP
jgi:glutamine synthetase